MNFASNVITFILFAILRISSVFVVQTFFVADEYFQSVEVAHRLVYDYGYTTWEWKIGLRSYLHPLLFATLFKTASWLGIDSRSVVVYSPRLLQALITAVGDLATVNLSIKMFGKKSQSWTTICLATSWFLYYCGSRTLSNTMEMVLTTCALYYFPWQKTNPATMHEYQRDTSLYLMLAAVATVIRPTAAALWIPLSIYQVYRTRNEVRTNFLTYFIIGTASLLLMLLMDRLCYGRFVFPPLAFLKFNLLTNQSDNYGTHPWHWYITEGLPVTLTTHLMPALIGMWKIKKKRLTMIICWHVFLHSIPGHKEFRFLLSILPLWMCFAGGCLAFWCKPAIKDHPPSTWRSWLMVAVMVVVNVFLALYFGLVHQRGTIDVMEYISSEASRGKQIKVLYLMPCHSTPYYSHVHQNISMRFLTCEPNLSGATNYVDEADVFYQNPKQWLAKYSGPRPTHIVIFDRLFPDIKEYLYDNYRLKKQFFHMHFQQGRVGNYVDVYVREQKSLSH